MKAASTVVEVNPKGTGGSYGRLSDEREGKLVTPAEQHKKNHKDAKRYGLPPIGVEYTDSSKSAFKVDEVTRDAFLALLRDIKAERLEYVIAVRSNRFARNSGEYNALLSLCLKHDVRLFCDNTEVDLASPHAKAMAQVAGVFNELDSATKSISLKIAHDLIADRGTFHGGPRPFGYLEDGVTLHPVEAPLYRELIERCGRGERPLSIANDWAERGIKGPRGTLFNTPRLRYLVFSPRHAGLKVRNGKPNGLASWPGIVTPEEQARAQAMFRNRLVVRAQRGTGRVASGLDRPLLQGIAHCALCKSRLVLCRRHGRTYYRCPSTGGSACGGVLVNADYADEEVEQHFLARLTQPKVQRELAKQQAAAPAVSGILERIDKIDGDLAMLKEMLDAREIDRDYFRTSARDLTTAKRNAEAELAASSLPAAITTDPETLLEKWSDLDVDEKRANLVAMLERVEVTKHVGPNRKVWNPDRVIPLWRDRKN